MASAFIRDQSPSLHASPSALSVDSRQALIEELNQIVCDGLDLISAFKVAHWNIKGPHFAALHPLFDSFAAALSQHVDAAAERATTLGGHLSASVREVAKRSRIEEYPAATVEDLDHVFKLAERMKAFAAGLRGARQLGEQHHDDDTVELLTGIILASEEKAWMLLSHLDN